MKVDFSRIILTDVRGEPMPLPPDKGYIDTIADFIYSSTTEVKLAMVAMDMVKNKGIVEVGKEELKKIKATFDNAQVKAWVKMPVINFIDEAIKELKDSKD